MSWLDALLAEEKEENLEKEKEAPENLLDN